MSNSDLTHLSDKEVWAVFHAGLMQAADGIRRAADAWVILEDRGVDVSRVRSPLTASLRAVASGKLSAHAALRFSRTPGILDAIGGIDVEAQDLMAKADYRIPVARPNGEVANIRPDDLSAAEMNRVFGKGFIRTADEQRKLLPVASDAAGWRAANADKFPCQWDTKSGKDNRVLYGLLGLQPRQQATLAAAAREAGITVAALIVRTLRAADLILASPGTPAT